VGCCGKKKKKDTVQTAKSEQGSKKVIQYTSAVKSNRRPAGRLVKQCSVCRTRSVSEICPICNIPMENFEEN
jgi:rubrerythrin